MFLDRAHRAKAMPHRKKIKHYHEPGDFHELTFSCYRRMPLLTNDAWRGHLARGLDEVRRGLCKSAVDWRWSSARWYVSEGIDVDADLPTIHGPPPELFQSCP